MSRYKTAYERQFVVMFLNRRPLYFQSLLIGKEFMSGMVVNGAWPLFIKFAEFGGRYCHIADRLNECDEENLFLKCDASEIVLVDVPKKHRRDYNDAIAYAESVDLE